MSPEHDFSIGSQGDLPCIPGFLPYQQDSGPWEQTVKNTAVGQVGCGEHKTVRATQFIHLQVFPAFHYLENLLKLEQQNLSVIKNNILTRVKRNGMP